MNISIAKQKLINKYKTILKTFINDTDFERFFDTEVRDHIIKYSELKNYSNINELLPNDIDYKIILTETQKNSGHWCALLKYGNTIEWFDSYGVRPDGELSYISYKIKKMLGENTHYLTKLLKTKRPDQQVIYNKTKFQKLNDNIATCGRHVICRILLLKMLNKNLDEYTDFIKKYSEIYTSFGE